MPKGITLEKIQKDVEGLSPHEQLQLVEKLAHLLKRTGIAGAKKQDWKKLYGLGKELWKGEDAQEYVNRLRENRI